MAPRPTVRGVISRAVGTLRRHWRPLLVIALAVFVPLGLLDVLEERIAELDPDELGGEGALAVLVLGLGHGATALFSEIALAGTIAAAVGDVHGTHSPRPLGELLRSIPYARLAAITVISAVGFAIGLVLLIVPGLVLLALFALAAPVAEVEDRGVRSAFARSMELSRPHVWLVLAVLVPLTILTEAAAEGAQALVVEAIGESLAGEWAGAVVAEILTSTPWALAAVALVYELRAAEGDAGTPAGSRSSPPPPP